MPKQSEIAKLTVKGQDYQDWETVSVKHQLREMPAYSCRFTCSEGSPLSKHLSKLQIMPGDECTVTLAGILAFTGKVTTRQVFVDARRHHIEIQCANNLKMAISSVVSKTMEWKNKEPEQIIRDVLKPLKIPLKIEGGQLPKFKIPRYSATHGESVHDFIDVLTRSLGTESPIGIAHTANPQGDFCILVGPISGGNTIVEGENMLEGREVIYDPYQAGGVPSPNQGPGNDQQHGADVSHKPFVGEKFETYGQKYVPSVVVPEIPFFTKDLHKGRATSESNWLTESYVTVYATVQGWLKPGGGGLWWRGENVTVNSPMLVMNGVTLILKSVTFSQDNSTGTRSVLELVNNKALGEGVPTPQQ